MARKRVAKLVKVAGVFLACPDPECGGQCVSMEHASYLILEEDQGARCEDCGTVYKVPTRIFQER